MELSQEHVSHWLEAYQDKTIQICKNEDGDLDEVDIKLQKVTIGKLKVEDPDDYVALNTLLLHGKGTIRSGGNDGSLPQNVYEIPLTDQWIVREQGNQLEIKTERAIYTIEPKN
jgi:hypothetical protein